MSRDLKATLIVNTLEKLHLRISERFPSSGLAGVASELADTSRQSARRARRVGRPYLFLRLLLLVVIVGGIGGQAYFLHALGIDQLLLDDTDPAELAQALESAVNLLILAGVAVWFLLGFEERLKRRAVFSYLHELRSYAHVIDMHQLTKDPTTILAGVSRTKSSPERTMTQFELARYLDYCAEMLALTGKLAALYAERSRDPQVTSAVNDVETLTTNLGRKIWQKIMIISELDEKNKS